MSKAERNATSHIENALRDADRKARILIMGIKGAIKRIPAENIPTRIFSISLSDTAPKQAVWINEANPNDRPIIFVPEVGLVMTFRPSPNLPPFFPLDSELVNRRGSKEDFELYFKHGREALVVIRDLIEKGEKERESLSAS